MCSLTVASCTSALIQCEKHLESGIFLEDAEAWIRPQISRFSTEEITIFLSVERQGLSYPGQTRLV